MSHQLLINPRKELTSALKSIFKMIDATTQLTEKEIKKRLDCLLLIDSFPLMDTVLNIVEDLVNAEEVAKFVGDKYGRGPAQAAETPSAPPPIIHVFDADNVKASVLSAIKSSGPVNKEQLMEILEEKKFLNASNKDIIAASLTLLLSEDAIKRSGERYSYIKKGN